MNKIKFGILLLFAATMLSFVVFAGDVDTYCEHRNKWGMCTSTGLDIDADTLNGLDEVQIVSGVSTYIAQNEASWKQDSVGGGIGSDYMKRYVDETINQMCVKPTELEVANLKIDVLEVKLDRLERMFSNQTIALNFEREVACKVANRLNKVYSYNGYDCMPNSLVE